VVGLNTCVLLNELALRFVYIVGVYFTVGFSQSLGVYMYNRPVLLPVGFSSYCGYSSSFPSLEGAFRLTICSHSFH
jgi:hypothetical protein